jgi:hypothetical protein
MLEGFVKLKFWSCFLDVRGICKGKHLEMAPRC